MVSPEVEVVDARPLPSRLVATVRGWAQAVRAALTRSGPERFEALLLLKAAVATVLAWQLAVHLLDSATPFYAPMAALLVVDRTMVRSLWASARRVAAVVVGMSIAWLVGSLVGVTWWSMVVVIFVALLIGRSQLLGDHGIQVPTMVLLSLITVNGTDTEFTYLTIVETVLGGVVGVAVNAVVLAPMHLDEPRDALRDLTSRLQDVVGEIAVGLREGWDAQQARRWYQHATDLHDRVPEVLRAVETGRESTRWNWRHRLRPARIDWDGYVTPSRPSVAPSGRWPASRAPSSTPLTTATGTRRRPRTGCTRTPECSTSWARRSRTSGSGLRSPVVRSRSTSAGRSRCST